MGTALLRPSRRRWYLRRRAPLTFLLLSALSSTAALKAQARDPVQDERQPLAVAVSTERGGDPVYAVGERLVVTVSVSKLAWVYLYYIDATGAAKRLWPADDSVRGAEGVLPPVGPHRFGDGWPGRYTLTGPPGIDRVIAVASTRPLAPSLTPLPLDQWPEDDTPFPQPVWVTPDLLYPPERASARVELRIVERL